MDESPGKFGDVFWMLQLEVEAGYIYEIRNHNDCHHANERMP